MILQTPTTSFRQQLLEGIHDFRTTGNVFKIALYTSDSTLNSSTTSYDGTTFEVEAMGYTVGGQALTNVDPVSYGTTGYTSFAAVSWTSTDIVARGALIYNHTAVGNPSVIVLDFGMDRYSESGLFTITFPLANYQFAIIRIN